MLQPSDPCDPVAYLFIVKHNICKLFPSHSSPLSEPWSEQRLTHLYSRYETDVRDEETKWICSILVPVRDGFFKDLDVPRQLESPETPLTAQDRASLITHSSAAVWTLNNFDLFLLCCLPWLCSGLHGGQRWLRSWDNLWKCFLFWIYRVLKVKTFINISIKVFLGHRYLFESVVLDVGLPHFVLTSL